MRPKSFMTLVICCGALGTSPARAQPATDPAAAAAPEPSPVPMPAPSDPDAPPGTDSTPQAPSPETAPIAAQRELTLEGGVAALNDGRYAQAAAAFEHAIAAQGESGALYSLLGRARLLAGEHGAARVALRRATQLEPNVAEHRLWFGHACRASGYMSAAASAYHNALLLEPGNAQAQAALRDVLADLRAAAPRMRREGETSAPHEVRYGGQTLAADGIALLLVVAGAAVAGSSGSDESAGEAFMVLGLMTYGFGGPIVHFAHKNVGGGLGSLGVRIAVPIVAGALGCAADDNQSEWGCIGGAAAGGALGILAAVIIDAGVLARTTEEPESNRDSADHAGLDWHVYAAPTQSRDGLVAGVSGRM